jgi:hypothetical protein
LAAGYAVVLVIAYTFNLMIFIVIAVGMVLPNWMYSKICTPKVGEVKAKREGGMEVCDEGEISDCELDVKRKRIKEEKLKNNCSKTKNEWKKDEHKSVEPKKASFGDVPLLLRVYTDVLLFQTRDRIMSFDKAIRHIKVTAE